MSERHGSPAEQRDCRATIQFLRSCNQSGEAVTRRDILMLQPQSHYGTGALARGRAAQALPTMQRPAIRRPRSGGRRSGGRRSGAREAGQIPHEEPTGRRVPDGLRTDRVWLRFTWDVMHNLW